MKTEHQLHTSMQGAIEKAYDASDAITQELGLLVDFEKNHKEAMPKIRKLLAELNQRVHEYNAYHNALYA